MTYQKYLSWFLVIATALVVALASQAMLPFSLTSWAQSGDRIRSQAAISPLPTPTRTPNSPLATPTAPPTPTAMETSVPPTATAIDTPTLLPTATETPTATATETAAPPTATPTVVTIRVEGQVLDQATGAGIADVLMTLNGGTERTEATAAALTGQVYTTTTDLNGIYVFPAVNPGAYTLTGVKAGVVIAAPAPVTVSGSQPIHVPALLVTPAQPHVYLPLVNRE